MIDTKRIADIIGTIQNHLAEPNEDWWEVLKEAAPDLLSLLAKPAPHISITHGLDGFWLCIDLPSGKHGGFHLEARPGTIWHNVLREVAIELCPEKPAPPAPGEDGCSGVLRQADVDALDELMSTIRVWEEYAHEKDEGGRAALAHLCSRLSKSSPPQPKATVTRKQIEKFVEGSIHWNMGMDELADAVQCFLRHEGVTVTDEEGK